MMEESSPNIPVFLVSTSPRRRKIIRSLDLDVRFAYPDGPETPRLPDESANDFVVRQAVNKSITTANNFAGNSILISADTIVSLDNVLMGKPSDIYAASEMLRKLSGQTHSVFTGIAVVETESRRIFTHYEETKILMRDFSQSEIAEYISTGEPMDKAGGYGIQDRQFQPAQKVSGCFLNVVGLPICKVILLLERLNIRSRLRSNDQLSKQCSDCSLNSDSQQALRWIQTKPTLTSQ